MPLTDLFAAALALVQAASAVAGASPTSRQGWSWPLSPRPAVVRPFEPPSGPWAAGHRGVDLSAAVGGEVLAPEAGRISFSGKIAGRSVVVVAHPGGLRSTLEPVRGEVPVGDVVATGEVVGTVTSEPDHCDLGQCLHWGVLRGEDYLDPLTLLAPARMVLLPLDALRVAGPS